MRRTVRLAVNTGVSIGAHPGFPDLIGFGRRNMEILKDELENYVLYMSRLTVRCTTLLAAE